MKILVSIVNYKTADMTFQAVQAALRELEPFREAGFHVVVVDNDSQDGSLEQLQTRVREEHLSDVVTVLASPKNGGFGYGNNVAVRGALDGATPPDFVYLLNSDAFPDAGAIATLVDYLEAHPAVGIAGSYIHGPDGEPHRTAFRFPSIASEFEDSVRLGIVTKLLQRRMIHFPIPQSPERVDWLAGASMMIRRSVLQDVGLFDETFFLYFEETDLCRRALLRGWPTVYVPQSSVTHIGGATTQTKDMSRPVPTYWFDSRSYYLRKSHGRMYLHAANAARLAGSAFWEVRRRIQRKSNADDPPHYLRDFFRHSVGLNA